MERTDAIGLRRACARIHRKLDLETMLLFVLGYELLPSRCKVYRDGELVDEISIRVAHRADKQRFIFLVDGIPHEFVGYKYSPARIVGTHSDWCSGAECSDDFDSDYSQKDEIFSEEFQCGDTGKASLLFSLALRMWSVPLAGSFDSWEDDTEEEEEEEEAGVDSLLLQFTIVDECDGMYRLETVGLEAKPFSLEDFEYLIAGDHISVYKEALGDAGSGYCVESASGLHHEAVEVPRLIHSMQIDVVDQLAPSFYVSAP